MKLGSSNILGIAVSDRAIICSELGGRADKQAIRQSAAFTIPEGLSFDKPEQLGQAFVAFLRKEGISATRAVIGVPAKWLIAAEKDVPPASDEQMRALLRLQAERMRVSDNDELVADYVGDSSRDKPGRVLLVGMLRKQIDRVKKTMEAAGLEVQAMTSTTLTLASMAKVADAQMPMLVLSRQGAELVWRHHGKPRMLRHVATSMNNGADATSLAPLGTELRRTVAMVPAAPPNGQGPIPAPTELRLWDAVGLTDAQVDELSDRLGMRLRHADGVSDLGVATPVTIGRNENVRIAPAVALAVAAARSALPVDFTASRLAPPPQRRVGKLTVWAAIAATIVVGLVAWLFIDVQMRRSELARLNSTLDKNAGAVKAAEELQDKVKYTRGYFTTRTPMLDVLREVTTSFRDSDPIWATRFNVKENRRGEIEVVLEGKTSDRAVARELSDRLRMNPRLVGVTLPSLTEAAAGRSRDQVVSFSINFKFVTAEVK